MQMRTAVRRVKWVLLVMILGVPLLANMPVVQRVQAASPPVTFTQSGDITIPTTTAPSRAVPYGIPITVPNNPFIDGPLVDVQVTLKELNHNAAFDLDVLVTNPSGKGVLLMSDAGRLTDLTDATITFDDAAATSLPEASTIATGTYKPTNYGSGDVFPSPAPAPPKGGHSTQLSAFVGSGTIGTWKLWIVDDFTRTYSGTLDDGWRLRLVYSDGTVVHGTSASAKILNATIASPYSSTINVQGLNGVVHSARVTLSNVQHANPSDMDMLLVGPDGQTVVLMSDAGGGSPVDNVDLTFRDTASNAVSARSLVSGAYRPTNLDGSNSDAFPPGAPPGPFSTLLSTFNGQNPNGVWRLYVTDDDAALDAGSIDAWSLTLEVNSAPVIAEMPDVIVDAGRVTDIPIPVTDLDGDAISFAGSTLPIYAAIITSATPPLLRLKPETAAVGTEFNATIAASDGSFSDTEDLRISVVEDNDPPDLSVIRPIANGLGWYADPVNINIESDDGEDGSGTATIRVQASGAMTFDSGVIRSDGFDLTIDVDGITTLQVEATDHVGNVATRSAVIQLDTRYPTSTPPRPSLQAGGRLGNSTVPVRVQWTGSDATSGLQKFDLTENVDGGNDPVPVPLPNPLATSITRQITPSHTYTYCVLATDNADNALPFSDCRTAATLTRVQEGSPAIDYSSGWTPASNAQFSGAAVRFATVADSSATYTFSGRSVAWVSTVGAGRGIAEVSIDGGTPVQVDLYATSQTTRKIVFVRNGLTNDEHTITIRVTGDKHPDSVGRRVDIDAFATLAFK